MQEVNFNDLFGEGKRYEIIIIDNHPYMLFEERVKRDTIPENLCSYHVREDDYGNGMPVTVENKVVVNFYGTIIGNYPIKYNNKGYHVLKYDNSYHSYEKEDGEYEFSTLEDYYDVLIKFIKEGAKENGKIQ